MLKKLWVNIKKYYKVYNYKLKLFKFYEQDCDKPIFILSILNNLFFLNLVLIIISYIWFIQRTHNIIFSLAMTITLMLLLNTAFYLRHKKLHNTKRNKKRRKIAFDYLMDNLKQLSDDEFTWQIIKLFFKLPDIDNIRNRNAFLESTLKGQQVAIGYYNDRFDQGVDLNSLDRFLNDITLKGYKNAIFITTGTYNDESLNLLSKKKYIKIHALDKKDLFKLMEKADMLPSESVVDSVIDSVIEQKISKRTDIINIKDEIINRKKIRSYFGFSILFMVLSGIITTYTLYYIIISALFLFLAIVSFFNGKTYDNKDHDNELPR